MFFFFFFFFKQKTAYEIKECDWSSDVCSSDLLVHCSVDVYNLHSSLFNVPTTSPFSCGLPGSHIRAHDSIRFLVRFNGRIVHFRRVPRFLPSKIGRASCRERV